MNLRLAAAKKAKNKARLAKIARLKSNDTDGSISEDDVELLEDNMLGKIINNYVIIKYVGRGTFSRVWLAYHMESKEKFILKIYFYGEDDEFKCEIKILNTVRDGNMKYNLNFIENFKANIDNNLCNIIVLPYKGITLSDIKNEINRDLTIKEVKYITKNILFGLNELHNKEIMHTDLKLDNILSDYYLSKDLDFNNWFDQLNVNEIYSEIYINFVPKDLNDMSKDKRKKVKRRVKIKVNKAFEKKLNDIINTYNDDIYNYENDSIENIELDQFDLIENQEEELSDNNTQESNTNEVDTFNITNNLELDEVNLKFEGTGGNGNTSKLENTSENSSENTSENIDLMATNFILSDYSNSIPVSKIDEEEEYQIRAYRAPENIIGYCPSLKSEIWSIGCLIWTLLTDEYLFEPKLVGSSESRDREQLAIMEKYCGRMQRDFLLDSPRTFELFEDNCKIKGHKKVKKMDIEDYLREKRTDLTDIEIMDVVAFLKKLLVYQPEKRYDISQCLQDKFLHID